MSASGPAQVTPARPAQLLWARFQGLGLKWFFDKTYLLADEAPSLPHAQKGARGQRARPSRARAPLPRGARAHVSAGRCPR